MSNYATKNKIVQRNREVKMAGIKERRVLVRTGNKVKAKNNVHFIVDVGPDRKKKKKKLLLFIAVMATTMLYIIPQLSQSALLTNIYSKKLSELTDFASRFLIVPHESNNNNNNNYNVNNADSNQMNENLLLNLGGQQDSTQIGGPNSNSPQDQQPSAAVSNNMMNDAQTPLNSNLYSLNINEQKNTDIPMNDSPSGSGSGSSPLAAAWKSLGGQSVAKTTPVQQQKLASSKLQQATPNNNNNGQFQQIDTSKVAGEPMIQADVSTEFPNPNINNLGHEITKILKKFFVYGYDKRVRPNYSGPPALVNVSFHIIGISSVDEVQMDFTTDFYFRQKWFDPRLEFDPVGEVDELCVGAEFAEKIWLPDTFFANEKTATFHKATTENTFIRIAHNGRVYRSIRLTVTCSCPMDLQYFPMDRQRCKIEIESYGYNTRDIDYRWERGDASVSLNTKIELPQFKILGFKMGQELQNLSSGDYIRLYCEIHFVRSMGYYLIQIYIPASLIVMISWVSFWLHRNATPARVALGVTTVLTMTTLMSSTNAALPKISYIKSIDVFLGTCFVMVFASLLEYASVGYIGKRIAMKRKRLQDLQQMQQHHQKVCVAAAASAAAAAAAAQEANPIDPVMIPKYDSNGSANYGTKQQHKDSLVVTPLQVPFECSGNPGGTLHRRSVTNDQSNSNTDSNSGGGDGSGKGTGTGTASRTLQRGAGGSNPVDYYHNELLYGQRSATLKDPKRSLSGKRFNHNNSSPPMDQQQSSRAPLLAAGAAIAAAAANQPRHAPTTEFEVSQTHDMIKICGLTPSAIDKHSRVVFPICFVCFNLMYWIIYGHISQQIEDKGPPLIPFIKG